MMCPGDREALWLAKSMGIWSVIRSRTARKLAILIYRMLKYGTEYVDEGAKAYEERFRNQRLHSIQNIAKSMGYQLIAVETTS